MYFFYDRTWNDNRRVKRIVTVNVQKTKCTYTSNNFLTVPTAKRYRTIIDNVFTEVWKLSNEIRF